MNGKGGSRGERRKWMKGGDRREGINGNRGEREIKDGIEGIEDTKKERNKK